MRVTNVTLDIISFLGRRGKRKQNEEKNLVFFFFVNLYFLQCHLPFWLLLSLETRLILN